MEFAIGLLAFAIFLLWVHFLWSRRKFYKVAMQLPGPVGWPFIGVSLNIMSPEKYLPFFERTAAVYKTPCISWMGTKCFLYVSDPETVELVFNSPQCINKGDFYRFLSDAIGDGLFTSSAPRWNEHRRLINPAFGRPILNNFLPIFNEEANALLKKFKMTGSNFIDLYETIKKSVLEAACQTTMGCKMNFQEEKSSIIFESYNSITELAVRRMLSPWLYPNVCFQFSRPFKMQQKIVGILHNFIEGLLQIGNDSRKASQNVASDNDDDNVKKTKSIFIEQIRNCVNQGSLTWDDVRDEANVIIAATYETTSTALYFVCLCLAIHPEYQEKLYDEIIEIFSDVNSSSENDDFINITKEQLDRMTCTEMIINESMRLFAPVPLVLRSVCGNDLALNKDIALPVGTQIAIDIFNMHRSEKIWGKKAKQFCPETHFGPNAAESHPFSFIPFTKGLRMCLGSRYAIMLMKVFLAKIFRYYRIHTNAKLEDIQIKGTISLKLLQYPKCWCELRDIE